MPELGGIGRQQTIKMSVDSLLMERLVSLLPNRHNARTVRTLNWIDIDCMQRTVPAE